MRQIRVLVGDDPDVTQKGPERGIQVPEAFYAGCSGWEWYERRERTNRWEGAREPKPQCWDPNLEPEDDAKLASLLVGRADI